MRMVIIVAAVLVALVLAVSLYVRTVPMRAAVWHVDPVEVEPPVTPNFALRRGETAPLIQRPAAEVATRLEAVAEAGGAQVIGGSADSGFVTYVVRTPVMGFPDAVSVRLIPEGDGTRVAIFSRSRFGYGDMGVNADRVARWIDALSGRT
ncbi:DUF1499 domain-containing protein [Rhodobacterales bacterium HKCCE3408]|nr:DUF1499 domain-containing protein [Rhodobacterales bacterium HKCCE3408]